VFRKNICRNSKGKINKGWKSFYEKYPGAHGVFEFSKIIYSGNYACFYAARYSGDFSARGDIVIMQKENGLWRILTYFNVWME
jgi:hypothetical protein